MSGNEMPGYPRVNSVLPPRSLNCNGYPGQQDYVGGQTNISSASSPAASTTTTTTTSTMHPPQIVPQSPSRSGSNGNMQQPPRPNSNNQMYTQQSPNPYHQNGGSGNVTPNNNSNGSYVQDNHHQSPNVHQQQNDWNAWNQSPGPPNDMFNQSDRVNLNSRIKTMILNKNDQSNGFNPVVQGQPQGQQQPQTGHFLSYSHHLRDTITTTPTLQPVNAQLIGSGSESSTENIGDGGNLLVGGPPLVDQMKAVSESKKEHEQSVFEHKQQLIEKSNSDPGGGILQDTGGGKKKSSTKSASSKRNKSDSKKKNNHEQQIDSNKSSSNNYNNYLSSDNNNSQSSSISSLSSASSISPYNHTYPPYSSDSLNSKFEPMNRYGNVGGGGGNTFQPQPGAFHTPQPQNPYLTNVKKEPGLLESGDGQMTTLQPQKYDGYEKNYQNFIRYADYCDAQQQNQNTSYYSPYNNYPTYQNYSNANYNQNYQAAPSTQQPPPPPPQQPQQQQQNVDNPTPPTTPIVPVPHQTNFEQQIPLHTYPIPKNNNSNPQNAEIPIKLEAEDNSYLGEEDSQKDPSDPLAIDNTGKLTPLPQATPPQDQQICNEEEKPKTEDLKTEHVPENIELKEELRPILSDKDKMEKANKPEIPECDCFPSDKNPPEPGSFYTHLGRYLVK